MLGPMRVPTLLSMTVWIDSLSMWRRWVFSLALVAIVGLADLTTAADVAFTLAYLLPVAIAAWHVGLLAAWVVAVASTLTSLTIDLLTQSYMPHPAIQTINLTGQLLVFAFFGLILVRLRQHLAREHLLATTDPLTGLGNRRAFWDIAEREIVRCRRFGQTFSVAYLDVDGFKAVNDRLGHRRGDDVLVSLARLLVANVRAVDCVARMGGDEFALLLPGTASDGARTLLDKLRTCLAQAAWNQTDRVRFSIGCLTVEDATLDFDAVIARADALMFAVKSSGKDGHLHEVLARPSQPVAR